MATKQSSRTKTKKQLADERKRSRRKAESAAPVAAVESKPVPKKTATTAKAKKSGSKKTAAEKVSADLPAHKIVSVWQLAKTSVSVLWQRRGIFLGIALVYVVLNLLLVQTASATNLNDIKQSLGIDQSTGNVTTGLTLFTVLVAASGNGANQQGAAYQVFLVIIISLATVWALREVTSGRPVRLKYSFYRGMYPLVPVLLVLLMIFVQLIPVAIGAGIFGVVVTNNIATDTIQVLMWALLLVIGAAWSGYLLIHSSFALYIASLPEMTPLRALRSAKKLVNNRRWTVLRKLIFLPLALLVIGAAIMFPIILFATAAASWVFFFLSILALLIIHSYMYALYRELLV